ncbi:uncharacterized protein LOC109843323 isoform X2 [Asparagus officinalis]|uniref:uncharacterized protein LOC109843323 isoform X2 n=1 Tax=Asparagus officinalis TaxID=4686 RepID=UPI00098E265E|nr:uncharacterized protein LOC109843323 isoform X2 [Asparagus officinalis]
MAAEGGNEKKRVMVAIDESECSHHALKWTLTNLRETLTYPIIVFTVQSLSELTILPAASLGNVSPELIQSVRDHQKKVSGALLEKAKEICAQFGIVAETVAEVGDPKEAICDAVEKFNINLLILGSHGRGVLKRSYLMKQGFLGEREQLLCS